MTALQYFATSAYGREEYIITGKILNVWAILLTVYTDITNVSLREWIIWHRANGNIFSQGNSDIFKFY